MNNKFTKEQFLFLAECEYVFADSLADEATGAAITEDLKKEILRLAEIAHALLPGMSKKAVSQTKSAEEIFFGPLSVPVSKAAVMHFQAATQMFGSTTKAALFPILYLAEKFKEEGKK